MYCAVYNKNRQHVCNVRDVKYNVVERVYDWSTFNFSGTCDEQIYKGDVTFFVFCDELGNSVASGFVTEWSQDGSAVSFKGDDLRRVFDTEVLLDFSQDIENYPNTVDKIFNLVAGAVDAVSRPNGMPLALTIPTDETDVMYVADYRGYYLIANAYKFLKPYLALHNYFLRVSMLLTHLPVLDTFAVHFVKGGIKTHKIRLEDFVYERKATDVRVNRAVATIKVQTVLPEHEWVVSNELYWGSMPEDMRAIDTVMPDANDYPIGFALRKHPEYDYYQCHNVMIPRPTGLPEKVYWLGTDNQVYEGIIPENKKRLPIITKIFEDEYLYNAQAQALTELVNNRYNENIMLTAENALTPIDLTQVQLYDMFEIYGKDPRDYVVLPVSEIERTNEGTKIKLGFKRTFFTEVVKHGK